MTRTRSLAHILWMATACGRVGFDDLDRGAAGPIVNVAPTLTLTASCGTVLPETTDLVVTNDGEDPLVIEAAEVAGGFSVATTLPLTIAPGASSALAIRPPAAVIGTDRGGATKAGSLTLFTNDVQGPASVALTVSIVGADVALIATNEALDLAFFGTSGACPGDRLGWLTNSGNLPASVEVGSTPQFVIGGFSSGVIEAGASAAISIHPAAAGLCVDTGSITYTVTGTVCSITPTVLAASYSISGASSCFCS